MLLFKPLISYKAIAISLDIAHDWQIWKPPAEANHGMIWLHSDYGDLRVYLWEYVTNKFSCYHHECL